MIAAKVVLLVADCLQSWYGVVELLNDVCHHCENAPKYDKKMYLPELTGTKTPVFCKTALNSDLPIPRSALISHFPVRGILRQPW